MKKYSIFAVLSIMATSAMASFRPMPLPGGAFFAYADADEAAKHEKFYSACSALALGQSGANTTAETREALKAIASGLSWISVAIEKPSVPLDKIEDSGYVPDGGLVFCFKKETTLDDFAGHILDVLNDGGRSQNASLSQKKTIAGTNTVRIEIKDAQARKSIPFPNPVCGVVGKHIAIISSSGAAFEKFVSLYSKPQDAPCDAAKGAVLFAKTGQITDMLAPYSAELEAQSPQFGKYLSSLESVSLSQIIGEDNASSDITLVLSLGNPQYATELSAYANAFKPIVALGMQNDPGTAALAKILIDSSIYASGGDATAKFRISVDDLAQIMQSHAK